jgi:tripartite-type tricarboxylate transporter receptor subunit TctC
MSLNRRDFLACSALVAAGPLLAQTSYPTRPIRVMVGFPPGGGIDLLIRLLVPGMSTNLGQTVFVENKPGATGTLANEFVARSPGDGYTLLATVVATWTTTAKIMNVRYDALRDNVPLSIFARGEQVFVTGSDNKLKTLEQVFDWVRANPSKASYGIIAKATQDHIAGEMLRRRHNLNWAYIPYGGGGTIHTALIRGDVVLSCMSLAQAQPLIESGKLVALAVAGTRESPFMKGVPAAGLPPYVADYEFALAMPAGVAPAVVSRLHDALAAAMAQPAVQEEFRKRALLPLTDTPAEAQERVRAASAEIAPFLASMNIQLE